MLLGLTRAPPRSVSSLQPDNEPEITIELSSKVERPRTTLIIYNYTTGYFEEVVEDEPLLDLLTLPSTVTLKEDLDKALHRFGLQWSDSEGQVRSDQIRRGWGGNEGVFSKPNISFN